MWRWKSLILSWGVWVSGFPGGDPFLSRGWTRSPWPADHRSPTSSHCRHVYISRVVVRLPELWGASSLSNSYGWFHSCSLWFVNIRMKESELRNQSGPNNKIWDFIFMALLPMCLRCCVYCGRVLSPLETTDDVYIFSESQWQNVLLGGQDYCYSEVKTLFT